jgi:hypothetical protein
MHVGQLAHLRDGDAVAVVEGEPIVEMAQQPQDVSEGHGRLLRVMAFLQQQTEIVVSENGTAIQVQRPAQGQFRLIVPADLFEDEAMIEVNERVEPIRFEQPVTAAQCLLPGTAVGQGADGGQVERRRDSCWMSRLRFRWRSTEY